MITILKNSHFHVLLVLLYFATSQPLSTPPFPVKRKIFDVPNTWCLNIQFEMPTLTQRHVLLKWAVCCLFHTCFVLLLEISKFGFVCLWSSSRVDAGSLTILPTFCVADKILEVVLLSLVKPSVILTWTYFSVWRCLGDGGVVVTPLWLLFLPYADSTLQDHVQFSLCNSACKAVVF